MTYLTYLRDGEILIITNITEKYEYKLELLLYFLTQLNQQMYSVDRYSKTRVEKFFLPLEINPKVILNALKTEQLKQQPCTQKPVKQTLKFEALQINGREVPQNSVNTQGRSRTKTKDLYLRKIKQIMNEPLKKVVQTIEKDPDYEMYVNDLKQLERYQAQNYRDKKNTEQKVEQNLKEITYYQQIIIDHPKLYNKIMSVYKSTTRQLSKETGITFKSTTRESPIKIRQRIYPPEPKMNDKDLALMQYRQFLLAINISNCISITTSAQSTYKAFIGKGNNGILVKSLIKTRPWWSFKVYSEIQTCNLIWTQWKRTKMTNNLPSNDSIHIEKVQTLKEVSNEKNKGKMSIQLSKIVKIEKFIKVPLYLSKQNSEKYYLPFSPYCKQINYEQFGLKYLKNVKDKGFQNKQKARIMNHVPGCLQLHSKKLLLLNMKKYYTKVKKDLNSVMPLTFLINNPDDPQFLKFVQLWDQIQMEKSKNVWICKPGQNSNRGNGISVSNSLNQIKLLVKSKTSGNRTLIIQKYIENPFLYLKRKFDIRCYILITTVNGILKGYWYDDGYIRTASKQYNLKNLENKLIHLTNDAIQKKGEEYGKFENYNKINFSDFQKYLGLNHTGQFKFSQTFQRMKDISTDLIRSTAQKLNTSKKQYSFQIFGLDYMLDEKLNPLLIEANSNPCLSVDGPVLGRIIPAMLENAFRIALDPVFPPPFNDLSKMNKFCIKNPFESNKFVLVYDSLNDQTASLDKNLEEDLQIQNQNLAQQEQTEQV